MTVATDKKISLGPYTSKIHKEELLELLDLWEFGPDVKEKIRALIDAQADRIVFARTLAGDHAGIVRETAKRMVRDLWRVRHSRPPAHRTEPGR